MAPTTIGARILRAVPTHDIYESIRTRTMVLRQGHVLLLPAEGYRGPDGSPVWRLPGGGLEPHETLAECARREVLEETGVPVCVGRVAFLVEWVIPRFAPGVDSPGGEAVAAPGFGLEVYHYATPEEPAPAPRPERPGQVPPRWVPLGDVPALPVWPKALKALARRLAAGRAPVGAVSVIGQLESPLAVATDDPFAVE